MAVSALDRSRVGGGVPEPRFRQARWGVELERVPPLGSRRIDHGMNAASRSEQQGERLNFRIPDHLFPENRIAWGRGFESCLPWNPPVPVFNDPPYSAERIGPLPRHHDLGNTLSKQQSTQDQKNR